MLSSTFHPHLPEEDTIRYQSKTKDVFPEELHRFENIKVAAVYTLKY